MRRGAAVSYVLGCSREALDKSDTLMNLRIMFALPVLIAFAAAPAAAQRVAPTLQWSRTPPVLAATGMTYSLPLPGRVAGHQDPAAGPRQREYVEPTPYVLGGTAAGAFAGGLVGYVNCVAGDRDCSVLWRLVAGTAIGGALGAVLWLGSVPQP